MLEAKQLLGRSRLNGKEGGAGEPSRATTRCRERPAGAPRLLRIRLGIQAGGSAACEDRRPAPGPLGVLQLEVVLH